MTNERLVKKINASEDKEVAVSEAAMRCSLFLFVPKYMEQILQNCAKNVALLYIYLHQLFTKIFFMFQSYLHTVVNVVFPYLAYYACDLKKKLLKKLLLFSCLYYFILLQVICNIELLSSYYYFKLKLCRMYRALRK